MSLRKKATSGLLWSFTQQFGNQLVGFIVSVVLARILLPEEFGLIGMIAVFIAVGKVVSDSGLTQSLIRSEKVDQEDFSTIFFFNLGISFFVYILIYLISPLISAFYEREILSEIIKIYSLVFIINAFGSVQNSFLIKKMNFRIQTFIAIPSTIVGGMVGIILAYLGYGVWSLVWSSLISSTVYSILLWFNSNWRPSFTFNIEKFKVHFDYGYKLGFSNLLSKLLDNLYLILIGKYFSAAQVGFYHRADIMKQYPVSSLSVALNNVTFPLFVSINTDDVRLKRVFKQLMQSVIYLITPLLIFMAVLAEPLFILLFTEKWLPAVPYFQILSISGIFYPLHAYNLNIIKVKGRSDLYLKLSVIKKVFIVVTIIIGLQFGIYGLLYSQVLLSFLIFFLNSWYTSKFINYTTLQQLKDIIPALFLGISCGVIIFYIDFLGEQEGLLNISRVLIGFILGGILYIGTSYFLKFQSFFDLKEIIYKEIHDKKKH